MALQVWLPLNGDLHNQGLSNVIVTNNGATINSSGKIGSCYSFNINQYMEINNVLFSSLTTASVCFWIKIAVGDGNWLPFTGQSTSYYILATSGGTGNFYHQNAGSGTIYCDGILRSSPINDGNWHHYCITNVNLSTWTKFYINYYGSTGAGWNFNGQMNDIRIYDHCLSPKEVKEISKGLLLHYKLNTIDSIYAGPRGVHIEPDGSKWVHIFHHNNPNGGLFNSNSSWSSGVYENEDRWFNIYGIVKQLTSYEFLVKQKTTSNATEIKYRWIQTTSPLTATYNDVKPSSVTRITNGYTDSGYGGLYILNSNTHMVTANTSNGNWWGATGCWTRYSNGIPGYGGNVVSTGYADLYIRIPDNSDIIYDCSGYQHNGTVTGTLTLNNDTPRYNNCTVFSSSRITSNDINLDGNNIFSISCWVKLTTSQSYQPIFWLGNGTTSQGFCLHGGSANRLEGGNGSNRFDNSTFTTIPLNTWKYLAFTYDGNTITEYVDGILTKTLSYANRFGSTLKRIYLGYFWGGNLKGNISDFRLYSTVLSIDDIKELYNTPANIDNFGNMFSMEFDEDYSSERELNPVPISGFTVTNDGYKVSGHTWPSAEYIPISPSGKTYYYDIEYSNVTGNHLYIGFERYDINKASGSNNECQYVVNTTSIANHVRVTGTINLSTANGNTAAFTKLRILNNWDNSSNVNYIGTIHYISLKEVTSIKESKIEKTGQMIGNTFIESKNASISKTSNIIGNQFMEK